MDAIATLMTHRKMVLFTIAMSSSDPRRRVGGAHALFTIDQALGMGRNGHMGVMSASEFVSAALCKTLEILASETDTVRVSHMSSPFSSSSCAGSLLLHGTVFSVETTIGCGYGS